MTDSSSFSEETLPDVSPSPSRDGIQKASQSQAEHHPRVLEIGKGWLPEQPGNGLDRVYHSLLQTLPEADLRVTGLVAGTDEVTATSEGAVRGFAPATSSLLQRFRGVRRATREILSEGVDLVASHFALYTFPILDLLREVPLVVHFHGPWAQESAAEGESSVVTWAKHALETLVYRQASRCIVLSSAFRDVLEERYGVSRDRIRIVPGGVDVERFAVDMSPSEARAQLGWPQDRPIVVSVRRLARRMGLENLIEAIDHLQTELPDLLLHVAGSGPLREELESRIEARGLDSHVTLLGFVPEEDLPLVYRAADVSVVPSVRLEGFGLITLESLAAGTPVLVTPVGGLPETVEGLDERLILPSASTNALARGLRRVLQDPSPLPSPEACRSYVRENFGWEAIAEQTRRVYREVY